MAGNSGDWQDQGNEDISLAERRWNPLAELAAEIELCYEAIEQHIGSFCTQCTCTLGYHLSCANDECESCGCGEIHKYCAECGTSRALDQFPAGSQTCQYCINIPPVKIKPIPQSGRRVYTDMPGHNPNIEEFWNRSTEARRALRELTE